MTIEQRAKALEQAAEIIDEVIPELDTAVQMCGNCQVEHHINWQDANFAPQLHAFSRKLRGMAEAFRMNPTGKFQPKETVTA